MNNSFSIKRFGLLLSKNWMEKRKFYIAGWLTYTLFVLISYVITFGFDDVPGHARDSQTGIYLSTLVIGGIVYAGLMFTDYSKKETGLFNLLLPASHLEKALVVICYGVLFYWIAVTGAFMLIDGFFTQFGSLKGEAEPFIPFIADPGENIFLYQVYFLFAQTLFVLGSIYFRKLAFFKTTLVIFILYLAILRISNIKEINDHYPSYSITEMTATLGINYADNPLYYKYEYTTAGFSPAVTWLIYGIGVLLYTGLCLSIYLRLKEKEL